MELLKRPTRDCPALSPLTVAFISIPLIVAVAVLPAPCEEHPLSQEQFQQTTQTTPVDLRYGRRYNTYSGLAVIKGDRLYFYSRLIIEHGLSLEAAGVRTIPNDRTDPVSSDYFSSVHWDVRGESTWDSSEDEDVDKGGTRYNLSGGNMALSKSPTMLYFKMIDPRTGASDDHELLAASFDSPGIEYVDARKHDVYLSNGFVAKTDETRFFTGATLIKYYARGARTEVVPFSNEPPRETVGRYVYKTELVDLSYPDYVAGSVAGLQKLLNRLGKKAYRLASLRAQGAYLLLK
jgi:hypothetical protein